MIHSVADIMGLPGLPETAFGIRKWLQRSNIPLTHFKNCFAFSFSDLPPEVQRAILLAAALDQNHRLIAMLQMPVKTGFEEGFNAPSTPVDPATSHRRNHRPGTLSRITADPEIEAYIRARLDNQTLVGIVADIAATFPHERRISLSSLSRWWAKNGKVSNGSISKS